MVTRRMMIQPELFGSNKGYSWNTSEDDVEYANQSAIAAHHDYCQLYQDNYSIRLWHPGRAAISTPGVYNTGDNNKAPELPMRAHIRGIKGNVYIRFDGTKDGMGVWRDHEGLLLDPQPDYLDTMNALSGMPDMTNAFGGSNLKPGPGSGVDYNLAPKIPLFVALYRGTYRQIDAHSGWEIDSGPADDPDVLLGLDITNPQVLEDSRLDWWDMDMVPAPRMPMDQTHVWQGGVVLDHYWATYRFPHGGSMHRYPINLDANKRMRADQVLWLHFATGTVRLPVLAQPEGSTFKQLTCAYYQGHKFSISCTGSMLVDTAVSL